MAFLRVKTIQKKHGSKTRKYNYVYEVENYRDGKKIKQKTIKFLGKLIKLNINSTINFNDFNAVIADIIERCDTKEKVVEELIKQYLKKLNFKQKDFRFVKGKLIVDLKNKKLFQNNKNVFLKINDGFLGEYSLKQLITAKNYKEIAKWLILSGLMPKPKIFDETDDTFKNIIKIATKFGQVENLPKMKVINFEEFVKKIGY
ncbi:MAG: hypothetical protein ACP5KK_00315 [Candidatus Nanoarchaeia archaeon]